MSSVELQVCKWGNSLAVRLPSGYAKRAGIKEGDTLALEEAPDGTLSLKPAKSFDRKAYARRLEKFTDAMPQGASIIDELRRGARY
jgi:antitoxin MazE